MGAAGDHLVKSPDDNASASEPQALPQTWARHPKLEPSYKPTIHTPRSASTLFALLPVPTEAKWTQSTHLDDIEAWLAEKQVFPPASRNESRS